MYFIKETPIFFEFLRRFLQVSGIEIEDEFLEKTLFLHSKCNCGQKDCGTVYLKMKKPLKKELENIFIFDTNKGYFLIHKEDKGYFEFEALQYEKFPYKKEIDNFFNKKRKINDKFPKELKNSDGITEKEIKKLDKYFSDLEFREPNIIDLGKLDI
jgi:hypothetical protein